MKSTFHIAAACLLVPIVFLVHVFRVPFCPATPAGVGGAVARACQESGLGLLVQLAADLEGKSVGVIASCLAKQLALCTVDGLCMRRPPKALWKVLLTGTSCVVAGSFLKILSGKKANVHVETLWSACAVCRSLLWLLAAKDGVGPTRPFCSLKTSTGKLLEREDRPNIGPGPMFGVQSAVWFPCSLLLFFLTWMSQAFLR